MRQDSLSRPFFNALPALVLGALWSVTQPNLVDLPHVTLSRAEPGIDQTVTESPKRIRLWFSERVSANNTSIEIRGPEKIAPVLSALRIDPVPGDPITVDLRSELKPGIYQVRWQTLGADGDTSEGIYRFTFAPVR